MGHAVTPWMRHRVRLGHHAGANRHWRAGSSFKSSDWGLIGRFYLHIEPVGSIPFDWQALLLEVDQVKHILVVDLHIRGLQTVLGVLAGVDLYHKQQRDRRKASITHV